MAQAWREAAGRALFVCHCPDTSLLRRIEETGFKVFRVEQTHPDSRDCELLHNVLRDTVDRDGIPPWVVLDGTHFDTRYQEAIQAADSPLVVIDDMGHLPFYHADVIINQNLHGLDMAYNHPPETVVLRGPDYLLLRQEFQRFRFRTAIDVPERADRLLITMGGADPENVTMKVLSAVSELNDSTLETVIVLGAANRFTEKIEKVIDQLPGPSRLLADVEDMPGVITEADFAICNGGTTVWEMAFLGLPALVISISPIEDYLIDGIRTSGVHRALGREAELNSNELIKEISLLRESRGLREELIRLGQNLIDGNGSGRIIRIMSRLRKGG